MWKSESPLPKEAISLAKINPAPTHRTKLWSSPHNICTAFRPLRGVIRKIGTIQRRLAWPLHKDDTLSRSGRSTDLNIYFVSYAHDCFFPFLFGFNAKEGRTSRVRNPNVPLLEDRL
ncbi:hypothetical protein B0H10DRAFT_1830765 [Mycena sp. CBHHK59/15]|nr:hypothetical protein B0H10DRAFT_1830765 [Mycena sp. CBHHK59/15]